MNATTNIIEQDGVLVSPLRQPQNLHQEAPGSIHNDAVATRLGFRGGTVAGIIHHEQFAPVLVEAFGPDWFERGSISLYYLNATTHAERVQAYAEKPTAPDNTQINIWMEHENGMRVLEGTAAIGESGETTYVRRRFESRREPGETRILANVDVGDKMPEQTIKVTREAQDERLRVATETLDWYRESSPWGGAVCTPVTMFRLLNAGLTLRGKLARAVGLYGAIEVNVVGGPLFVERDYKVQGRVLAKGETPKSEYLWWESTLRDESGSEVANLLMMNRWMKLSSELYR